MLSRLAIIYIMVVVLMYFFQRHFIYIPNTTLNLQSYPLEKPWQKITTKTQDGLLLTSWYLPAKEGHKTILYLHGNAEDVLNRVPLANTLHQYGYGVFLLEYRGYANNPGKPTEQGLYLDSQSAYGWLIQQGIKPSQLIVYGESLGTANTIKLAAQNPCAGIILDAPFYSMVTMGENLYPWLPIKFLLKDKYLSNRYALNINVPTLTFYGLNDQFIPFSQVNDLMALIPVTNKWLVLMPDQTHFVRYDQEMGGIISAFDRLYLIDVKLH